MSSYLHGHAESVLRAHRWRTATNSAAYLLPHLRPGLDLLDVGCGPGSLTADLAARVAPGRTLGVDSAAGVLEEARRAAADLPVELVVGDAHRLDLPDDSVDVAHAHQVLQHVEDPVAVLREMRRVVRPGGLVAVRDADYAAMTWAPSSPWLDRWLEVYRATARGTRGEPDAGRRLLGWVQEAGMVDVVPSASAWCFATAEDRAWWGGLWAERAVASTFAEQAVAQGHATGAELQQVGEAFLAWSRRPDGWWAVLHAEVLATVR